MEEYAKLLIYAMPSFFFLVLIEKAYGWYVKKYPFKTMDTISSLSSGLTNVVKDVLKISLVIVSYGWMVDHLAIYTFESKWWMYVVGFIAIDFQTYWGHRVSHEINFLWTQHLIHHSSEEFDLPCALRQPISTFTNSFIFFLLPAAILGVPDNVIAVITPLHFFAQFWYHTSYINKLGFLERIIITPSHHRVHHSVNPEYMDKNYGTILIIWDKLFGTFKAESQEVPCVYGVSRPSRTWNPIVINFEHLWLMIKDAWRTNRWIDKFTIWFKSTGYRPTDVEKQFPITKIDNVYTYEKYQTQFNLQGLIWTWTQFLMTALLTMYLFIQLADIAIPEIYLYGLFIYLCVFAYTEMMNKNAKSIYWELVKNASGLLALYYFGGWFGAPGLFSAILMGYFIMATPITYWVIYSNPYKPTL